MIRNVLTGMAGLRFPSGLLRQGCEIAM